MTRNLQTVHGVPFKIKKVCVTSGQTGSGEKVNDSLSNDNLSVQFRTHTCKL